jgi:hypothetical protein
VGDLVVYHNPSIGLGTGIVVGFDHDNDPIIVFRGDANDPTPQAFYRSDIEVISENR